MSINPQNQTLKLPSELVWIVFVMFGFVLYTIWDQLFWWNNREDYSFGYLVPVFVAYVLYERRPIIRSYLFRGAAPDESMPVALKPHVGMQTRLLEWVAIAIFGASLLLFAIGVLLRAATGPQNPASLAVAASLSGLILSGVFIFSKETVEGQAMSLKHRLTITGLFLFPALVWLISAPLVSFIEIKIKVFLMTKVTIVVHSVLNFLHYDIVREGNVLVFRKGLIDEGRVGVEEACSGIRSLTACLFAGSFLAAVFLDRFWKKILLVFAAMLFAVLTNLMRSFFLSIWAYNNGSDSINEHWVLPLIGDIGTVHDVTGMAILLLTCIGLIGLLPIMNFKLKEF